MKKTLKKALFYFGGLFLMTIGLNVSKLSNLGITAASSTARVLELITPLTLGVCSMIVFIAMVALQFVLLRRRFTVTNILGIPMAVLFGYLVDITGTDPEAFGHLLIWVPRPGSYPMQLLYMVISVIISGIGIFMYLRPKWIPMPSEGLAGALSAVTHLSFGNCKTIVDCSVVAIALVLQFIFLGGLAAFTGDNIIIREGTIISAICMGQIVRLMTKWTGEKIERWFGR